MLTDAEIDALIAAGREKARIADLAEYEKTKDLAKRAGQRLADDEEKQLREIVTLRGDTVATSRTRWLWRDRIPLGGLSLIAGKGDVSKSTLLAQFVAWLTTGGMKGEYFMEPQTVLYVVNEDSIGQTVAPRMMAHGADMSRVHFLSVKSPLGEDAVMLPRDADLLRRTIRETGAVAVFIDPLSANVTGRKNDQGDMRSTYQGVNRIAEEMGIAIVGLAHTRKEGAGDVITAVMGSSEQTNVARGVHGLVMDPEEDGARILSCEKLNVGQRHLLNSLRFAVESIDVICTNGDVTSMPKIVWLAEVTDTASDILADALAGNTGVDECAQWLRMYLTNNGGEALASDVRGQVKGKWSEHMLKRARKRAGVMTKRLHESQARSMWYLET